MIWEDCLSQGAKFFPTYSTHSTQAYPDIVILQTNIASFVYKHRTQNWY